MQLRTPTLAVLLWTGVSFTANAQSFVPIVLRVPASTRMLALGDAAVASRDDDVVFYDPAQVAIARGTSASGERYTSSTSGGAISTVVRLATGGVGVGASWIAYGSPFARYPVSRGDLATPGSALRSTSMLATIAIAQTYKRFRVGVAGKYLADAQGSDLQSVVADVGVSRDVGAFGVPFTAAFAVQNIGSDFDVRPSTPGVTNALPTRYTLGAAGGWPVGLLDLAIAAQASMLPDRFFAPAGGMELGYSWLDGYAIAGRVGVRRPEAGTRALTAGGGIQMDRLTIDYALETLDHGHVGQRVGLRIR